MVASGRGDTASWEASWSWAGVAAAATQASQKLRRQRWLRFLPQRPRCLTSERAARRHRCSWSPRSAHWVWSTSRRSHRRQSVQSQPRRRAATAHPRALQHRFPVRSIHWIRIRNTLTDPCRVPFVPRPCGRTSAPATRWPRRVARLQRAPKTRTCRWSIQKRPTSARGDGTRRIPLCRRDGRRFHGVQMRRGDRCIADDEVDERQRDVAGGRPQLLGGTGERRSRSDHYIASSVECVRCCCYGRRW